MPVSPDLAGSRYPATEPYVVTAERVAAFAEAAGATYTGGPAPATFPIVVAFRAMTDLMQDPSVGIALHRVVHGEQRFVYSRPVAVGDRLTGTLSVDSLRQIGGADIIGTSTEIRDAADELVVTAYATLVHRGEDG
jgi:acyl dehydratase